MLFKGFVASHLSHCAIARRLGVSQSTTSWLHKRVKDTVSTNDRPYSEDRRRISPSDLRTWETEVQRQYNVHVQTPWGSLRWRMRDREGPLWWRISHGVGRHRVWSKDAPCYDKWKSEHSAVPRSHLLYRCDLCSTASTDATARQRSAACCANMPWVSAGSKRGSFRWPDLSSVISEKRLIGAFIVVRKPSRILSSWMTPSLRNGTDFCSIESTPSSCLCTREYLRQRYHEEDIPDINF